jgi:ABC-type multidrug transport system fused ATPase/permease subunit
LSLVVIENAAWILEPSLFAPVIDAFIELAGNPSAVVMAPLMLWIAVFAVNSGVGSLRRAFDDRIYLRVYEDMATTVALRTKAAGHPPTVIAGRTELSREFISFFQYRIPEIIEQFIDIGGAIIALTFYDWRIALTCLAIILPLLQITRWYNGKILVLQKDLHDRRERAFEVYGSGDADHIRTFVREMARPQVSIARWGALNFGIVRTSLLAIFLVVLYIATDVDEFSTGDIYAIVAYLWTFVTSSEYLPELMESWTSLKEISRRIRAGELEDQLNGLEENGTEG